MANAVSVVRIAASPGSTVTPVPVCANTVGAMASHTPHKIHLVRSISITVVVLKDV